MDKQGYEEMIAVLTRVINKQQVTTWGLCGETRHIRGSEPLFKKQEFKVGDKVRIKDGWSNSYLYVPALDKFIGLEGEVKEVNYLTGNYKVRTELDGHVLDSGLYNFPPEALELVL